MLGLKNFTKVFMIWPKFIDKNLNKKSVFLFNSRLSSADSADSTGYLKLFVLSFDS